MNKTKARCAARSFRVTGGSMNTIVRARSPKEAAVLAVRKRNPKYLGVVVEILDLTAEFPIAYLDTREVCRLARQKVYKGTT